MQRVEASVAVSVSDLKKSPSAVMDDAAGQTVAVVGPSGSGKSSLMAVLSGLERATGGSLQVAGADFATMDGTYRFVRPFSWPSRRWPSHWRRNAGASHAYFWPAQFSEKSLDNQRAHKQ